MATIDLDAARAARAEAQGEENTVLLGGDTFTLPLELPIELGDFLVSGRVGAFIEALLGEEQWTKFASHKPTLNDLKVLAEQLAPLYGFESPGESPASVASLPSNGSHSRPTSRASTGSTSRKRSGAKTA